MARLPRIELAGIAQHVIHCGNNRHACFKSDTNRRVYLDALQRALWKNDCALHAYVLMTNHVHLLMTPREAGGVARMMQSLGRRYVRYFNTTHRRTGTLREGRYALGSSKFKEDIEKQLGRNVSYRSVGRPRNVT